MSSQKTVLIELSGIFISSTPLPLYCPGPSCSSEYLCWRGLRRSRIIFSSCSWWYFYNHYIFFRIRGYIWHWAKPELSILPTVDDEVDGTVEDYEEVGDSHGHLRFICSSESKVHLSNLSSIIVIIVIVIRGTDNQYFLVFRRTKIFYYKEILRNSRIYLHETAPQSLLGIFIKKL